MQNKIKNFLHKLQQKSDMEKRVIAFNSAFLITIVIFILWAVSTFGNFGNTVVDDVNSGVSTIKNQTATPISAIKDSFKNLVDIGKELYE